MNKGMHESWADDYQRTEVINNPAELSMHRAAQWDAFMAKVEKGDMDDWFCDMWAERVFKTTLLEYLGVIQESSKDSVPKAYEHLGRYIYRCIGGWIEDAINDTYVEHDPEADYDG